MRARLICALKQPHTQSPKVCELATAVMHLSNKHSWDILQSPDKIRICTIDSLCHEIASSAETSTIENLSISPDPEQLYISAIVDMLSNYSGAPWEAAVIEVLNHIGNDFEKLQKLLTEMLRSRDIWLPLISATNDEQGLKNAMLKSIKSRNDNIIELLKTHFPTQLLEDAKKFFGLYLAAKSIDEAIDLPGDNNWKLFADFILTTQNTVRKTANKDTGIAAAASASNKQEKEELKLLKLEANSFFAQIAEESYFIKLLIMLRHIPTEFYTATEWQDLKNIMQIMPIAAAYLNLTFERHAACDFIAINLACSEALGPANSHSDLAISLSNNIRHILVDEFQDTSLSQLELLKKLTISWEEHEEKSLFLVGDPMQSIYKFRQADVAIFLSLIDNNLGNIKLNHLSLSVNFRSTNKVVAWVNSLFSALFSEQHIPNSGQVNFSKAEAYNTDDAGGVEFNITMDADDNYQNELIAKQITELLPKKESIAVLVRSRNHLHDLSAIFDKYNISYIQEDIIPLTKIQAAIDIAHLHLALANFSNKISWLSLLSSPLCGLKYQSIHLLASNTKHLTVWEAITRENKLPEDEANRLKYFLSIISHALQKKGTINNAMWLESTWISLGGPNFLKTDPIANSISKLFHNLATMNIPASWDQWQQLLSRQYLANESSAEVAIMTIHKAKGLEFDHVFLPAFNKKPPAHKSSLLNWSAETNNLIISPIASDSSNKSEINNYLNYIAKLQNTNEDIRVLYVAATRAKKHLYIYANAKTDNENNIAISSNSSFISLAWDHINKNTINYFTSNTSSHKEPQNHTESIVTLEHLQNTALTTNINTYHHTDVFGEDNYYTIRGTIIHKYIEKIANLNTNISSINIAEITSNLVADITESTLDRNLIKQMKTEIIAITHDFTQTPFAAWILDPEHKMCHNEYAITIKKSGVIKNIVIDRTFIDNNNDRWIIDYKTTSEKPLDFESFAAEQKNKYYKQLLEYAQAFRSENRNIICCLYFMPSQEYLTFNI